MRLSIWPVVILLIGLAFFKLNNMHTAAQRGAEVHFITNSSKAIGSILLDSSKLTFHLPPLYNSPLDGVFLIFPDQALAKSTPVVFVERMGKMENLSGAWGISSALRLQTKEPVTFSQPIQISVPFPAEYWERSNPMVYEVDAVEEKEGCASMDCRTGILFRNLPAQVDEEDRRFVFRLMHLPATVTWYYKPRAH